jgi:hypothetical protein
MINEMMTKFNFIINDVKKTSGPKLPPYLKNIIINTEGSKQTYNLLNTKNKQPTNKVTWTQKLDLHFEESKWKEIYEMPF